jgi:dTDP-glucose 4,6-dehydratase
MIEGIFRLAMSNISDPVNVGNPREMTVMDFAREILRLTGSASKVVHKPLPVDDPKVRQPDISKARHELGWGPKVKLEDGLRETIEYFKIVLG